MADNINPYIAGNPVTGTEMFFDRDDVFDFIRRTLVGKHRDNVIVLYGQRRTGKTSVLYQMRSRLDTRYLCIFMDLHGFALQGLDGFLWELANHIIRVLRRDYQIALPRPSREEFVADPRGFFENEFLNQIWSAIGDRHVLLMLDEAIRLQEQVEAGKLEHEIFEYMRHLMQHYERLNFLFSLGSGLEEMEKEYSFLFNVGLYKKISFLDRNATSDLITQPVKDCYQVEPDAVERIYHITSGYPYYTQLVCHCLFNCWVQQHMPHIRVQDVDEVLNEAVERGSAVLKHVWEESTPAEKAILASMASTLSHFNDVADANDINRAWASCDVVIPKGEMAKAIRSLIARDVIAGQDKYTFTVDLQRLWVQKHRRLEWVKEEIADTIREWSSDLTLREHPAQPPLPPLPPRRFSTRLALTVGLVLLLIISSGIVYYYTTIFQLNQLHQQATATAITNQRHQQATATATASHYPFNNNLVLEDPLNDNSKGYSWSEYTSTASCQFTGGAYAASTPLNYSNFCYATATNFGDFAFEIQMKIIKGDCGSILFRANSANQSFYSFGICQNGLYGVSTLSGSTWHALINKQASSAINQGLGQTNLVAVIARGSSFDFYVNSQKINSVSDSTYSQGQIGASASGFYGNPTEVLFSNAKVWILS